MSEDQDMRKALATLLARPRPFDISGTDLVRAGRTRRRRRIALAAATLAVLLAIPTTALAIASNHQTQPGQPDPNQPRLVLPQRPCTDGIDNNAGLSAAQVSAIKQEANALVQALIGYPTPRYPRPLLAPRDSVIALYCRPGERKLYMSLNRIQLQPPKDLASFTLVVGTNPVQHAVAVPETTAGGIPHHTATTTADGRTRYYLAAEYGPYCSVEYAVSTFDEKPRPFQSDAQLQAFLHDPRLLDLARRLDGQTD